MQVYLLTTTWNETHVHHGETSKEAITNLLTDVEELQENDIASCVQLNIPIVEHNTPVDCETPF